MTNRVHKQNNDAPGSAEDERGRSVLVHLSGPLILVVGSAALLQFSGRLFHGLLGLTLPLGPALVARAIARGPKAEAHRRQALAYSLVAAVVICGSWFGVRLALSSALLAITFPVFLLVLLFSLTNYVVMSLVAATKANRGELFEYPWVPERLLDRITASHQEVPPNGNG